MATEMDLAAEAEKKAQDALKKKQAEDAALLASYQTGSQGIYDTSKSAASGLLGTSKSDIENLYSHGYANLQDLVGQESEAAIKESLRPIEGKLATQGLLGGPSGALNEALAGASERVRNAGISRLADYQGKQIGALANMYGNVATQQANLEDVYGQRQQGLLGTSLENALSGTSAAAGLSDKYTTAGLEAALGTNQINVQQEGQGDLLAQQGALDAAIIATRNQNDAAALDAQNVAAAEALKASQRAWDNQVYNIATALYAKQRQQTGWAISHPGDGVHNYMEAAKAQLGPRPA